MNKIKLKLIGFDRLRYGEFIEFGFFLEYLKNQITFEIVEIKWDLIITDIFSYETVKNSYPNSKILTFSAENLYYSQNVPFGLGILRKFNLHDTFLKKFLPNKKFEPRMHLLKELNKNNNFWILCNDNKRNNILNFPYFFDTHLEKINQLIEIKKQKLYMQKSKFCAFIVANGSEPNRIKFFHKLSKYKKVDSFGTVLNNTKVPIGLMKKYKFEDISLEDAMNTLQYSTVSNAYQLNQELLQSYKFVICFENSYADDYT